jgi:hypothetical protein
MTRERRVRGATRVCAGQHKRVHTTRLRCDAVSREALPRGWRLYTRQAKAPQVFARLIRRMRKDREDWKRWSYRVGLDLRYFYVRHHNKNGMSNGGQLFRTIVSACFRMFPHVQTGRMYVCLLSEDAPHLQVAVRPHSHGHFYSPL